MSNKVKSMKIPRPFKLVASKTKKRNVGSLERLQNRSKTTRPKKDSSKTVLKNDIFNFTEILYGSVLSLHGYSKTAGSGF